MNIGETVYGYDYKREFMYFGELESFGEDRNGKFYAIKTNGDMYIGVNNRKIYLNYFNDNSYQVKAQIIFKTTEEAIEFLKDETIKQYNETIKEYKDKIKTVEEIHELYKEEGDERIYKSYAMKSTYWS